MTADIRSANEYCAWLASASMPSATVRTLLSVYRDPAECFRAVTQNDKQMNELVTSRFLHILEANASDDWIQNMRSALTKYSIGVFTCLDPGFPEILNEIEDPPAILFYQGNLSCLNQQRIIAMVGSRAASYEGQKASRKLAEKLSSRGVTVISGFASGIDTAAHSGCIQGGSPTIAVTGCGLDIIYPRSNIYLHDQILEKGGLILSEYTPGEKPLGWHFPYRNRLITGIAAALVLIEAKIKSGSMTSVHHALNQGKDVFVYPGLPDSEYFEGNHQLLREGGIYFSDADDILEDLHWLDNPTRVMQNSDCSTIRYPRSAESDAVIKALTPGALGFDQLLSKTGLDAPVLLSTLTVLQIGGMIEALPGKRYQIKH